MASDGLVSSVTKYVIRKIAKARGRSLTSKFDYLDEEDWD